jgi:molybdate transport system ATP-binding protein
MAIKLIDVTVKKGATTVLDTINLEINSGENWAILGENGSGKTTLLNLLAGREYLSEGLCERQMDAKTVLVANNFVGNPMVQQAYQFYQQRYSADGAALAPTVYEIVQNQVKPLNTSHADSVALPSKNYPDTAIEEWANLLTISHLLSQNIVTLSNGETRRVHLLMALLKKPQLLLLDNPFVGLDVGSRQILYGILKNITAAGIQIVMVCAAAEMPEEMTHAVVLQGGKIAKILRGPQIQNLRLSGDLNALKNTPDAINSRLDADLLSKIKEKPLINDFEYALRFRHITVQYGAEKVIDDISWDIKKGEKWALLGPNGSGKSTLLSLITADNPQAYRNDFDLFDRKRGTGESVWDIKKRIGFVSPELHLYADARNQVWKIIASGLFDVAQLNKPLTETEAQIVKNYLELLGLQAVKNKLLYELSSGQQRLVFLARALVKNPPLLILDEPCQSLDLSNMVYFRELINELVVSLDKTLIYVTHYQAEIPACINQVFRIEKGKRRA